jgi:hypothetical protein
MSSFTIRPILYTGVLLMMGAACTGIVAAPDEGAGSSTGVAVCSSNVYWKELDKGSDLMHPGGKCNDCHNKDPMKKAPNYTVAGTVFPTPHEPDDCNGVVGRENDAGLPEIAIVITDHSGRQMEPIRVNSVGNFQSAGQVIMPFNVKVVVNGKENKMVMQAPHGDCNACHTQTGAEGAPGRIFTP